jgi:xanthine dehydrogenase accessory factor
MEAFLFRRVMVLVLGGGDLASGVIYRVWRAGFPVVVTELDTPLLVRRAVSYGSAVYEYEVSIEGITARLVDSPERALSSLQQGIVPVLIDPDRTCIQRLHPTMIVDARMAKTNLGTRPSDAPLVIGLGPGFSAGTDCHAVIETNRGHHLGRVILQGSAEPDTGTPGSIEGKTVTRVLRAPVDGHVSARSAIGDSIAAGQIIADVNGVPIAAPFAGVLRGIIHQRVSVQAEMKIGDLDPRIRREACFTISDKSLAVGGGVVEAILSAAHLRPLLLDTEPEPAARPE